MFKRLLPLLLAAALLCGCAAETLSTEADISTPSQSHQTETPTGTAATPIDIVEQLLSEMTLQEKVGQLFIIRPDSLDLTRTQEQINDSSVPGVTELTDAMAATLRDYPVGGIAMFGKNIDSPGQLTVFLESLQSASDIPLFLCVDEEGGLVARLANHSAFLLPKYESAASVGETGDVSLAREMGSTIGSYLREYGFNLNFAPVADVNTNPDNPVIGTRAFSPDPEVAAQMAGAAANGLRQQGIIAVFKHFPGHGDTAEDSHNGIAVTYRTAAQMSECEWLPFMNADRGDFIMVGHIAAPEITGDMTPATMSSQIVTGILKNELGFQGLVITDSLAMEAITDLYTPGEAALAALRAGCDILLMPDGLQSAFDAVVSAVKADKFPAEQLDAIVGRILRFKQAHGLLFSEGVG